MSSDIEIEGKGREGAIFSDDDFQNKNNSKCIIKYIYIYKKLCKKKVIE